MEDDLIIGQVPEEGEGPFEEDDFYIEETAPSEYIAAATNALNAVSDIDEKLANGAYAKRIKRRSLRIIDHYIGVMYKTIFEEKKEDEI